MKTILLAVLLSFSVPSFALTLASPDEFSNAKESTWEDLGTAIDNTKDRHITIYWSGEGGLVNMAIDFINHIEEAKEKGKRVTFILNGDSYSAHAVVVCYASDIKGLDRYFLMFHNEASASNNKPMATPDSIAEVRDLLSECVKKGILTEKDVTRITQVTEVYVKKEGDHYIRKYAYDRRL